MKLSRLPVLLVLAALLGLGSALAQSLKVGLVTDIGGLNDRSYNQSGYEGLLQAEKELGIQGSVVQSKSQGDYVPNLSQFARSGYDLVIGLGFLMHDAVEQVAQEYPNTHFVLIDSEITDRSNVASILFHAEQSGYLAGALAGMVEKDESLQLPGLMHSQIVSVVGGLQNPEPDRYIAGFFQGVKDQDPSVQTLLGYTGSYTDPASGKQLALAQHSKGADIVFQVAGATGLGVIQAAKDNGFWAIGVDSDQAYLAPKHVLTSALKRVDQAVFQVIKDYQAGTFHAGVTRLGLESGAVGIGTINPDIPQAMLDKLKTLEADIKSGKIKVQEALPNEAGQ